MLGFLLFDDKDKLIFVYGDTELRKKFLEKEMEFMQETTSGYSELNSSTPGHDTASPSSHNLLVSKFSSGEYDLNSLSQFFIPLVVMYLAKNAFDGDRYEQMVGNSFRFCFKPIEFGCLLIAVSSDKMSASQLNSYALQATETVLCNVGPLLSCLSGQQMSMKMHRKSLSRWFAEIDVRLSADTFANSLDVGWLARALDISASADQFHPQICQNFAAIAQEFQVFLGSVVCLLVHNQKVISISKNSLDDDINECHLSSHELLLLLLKSPNLKDKAQQRVKCRCTNMWLRQNANSIERELCDVYRMEIRTGLELICIGKSDFSSLIGRVSRALQLLDRALKCYQLLTCIEQMEITVRHIVHSLADMVPDEADTNRDMLLNLQRTAQTVYVGWQRIKHILMPFAAPKYQTPTNLSPEAEVHLGAYSNRLCVLLQQLVSKSADDSRTYKLGLFEKCWSRINSSKHHEQHFKALVELVPDSGFENIVPSSLNLDVEAYVFLAPAKRVCFWHVPPHLRGDFGTAAKRLVQNSCWNKCALLEISELHCSDIMLLLVTNDGVTAPQWTVKKGKFMNLFGRKSAEPVNFRDLHESVWCLVALDQHIHKNLAVNQAHKLATELFRYTNSMSLNE